MKRKLFTILALLCLTVTSAWATNKSIDDIAVDDIIKVGDVISYTNGLYITYDGHEITLGNFTFTGAAGTVTVTRGIPDYTNVEDTNGAYFLFNDSQTGLKGSYGLQDKTLGGIPYNESGLKVTGKTWEDFMECYTLTVELAPAPAAPAAYAITVMEGAEDAANWSASPNPAAAGQTVTVTYGGTKHVKGFKVRKKAAAPAAAEGHPLSASEVGEIVCSDGLAYYAADKDNLPTGVTAVAIVAYVGDAGSVDASSSTYKGLAIAMSNANDDYGCDWGGWGQYNCVSKSDDIATAIGYKDGISSTNTLTSDGHSGHNHEAATAAVSNNGTAAPTGTSGWFLPSIGQWNLIVQGLASKKAGSAVTEDINLDENDTYKYSNLNSVITDAGGMGFNGDYQSSTQYDSEWCWHMKISKGRACGYPFYAGDYVRSVLAF